MNRIIICSAITLVLMFFNRNQAQPLSLGLKWEGYKISRSGEKIESNYYLHSYYLLASYKLSENIKINIQPGLLFGEADKYFGFETSIYTRYHFLEKSVDLISGLNLHSNIAHSSYSSNYHGVWLVNGLIGVGLTKDIFLFDLSFLFPLGNSEYGVRHVRNSDGSLGNQSIKLSYLIKLGVGLSFEL